MSKPPPKRVAGSAKQAQLSTPVGRALRPRPQALLVATNASSTRKGQQSANTLQASEMPPLHASPLRVIAEELARISNTDGLVLKLKLSEVCLTALGDSE